MFGEKCQCCGDEVLILKSLAGKRLCLDCYSKYKDDETFKADKSNEDQKENPSIINQKFTQDRDHGDRRCPNCGRIIPFDSIICPYCGKKFESFL